MLNLLKYEWMRRRRLLIGAVLVALFVEGIVLYGIWRGGNWNILSAFLTMALVVGGLLLPILDTVTQYYSDFKQKHGYMLFMTPTSGYRIIGSKALFALMELIAVIILVGGCITASGYFTNHINNGCVADLITTIRQQWEFQTGGSASLTPLVVSIGLTGILQLFTEITIAVLALTVSKVMLPGKSFNWLIALVMYFAFTMAIGMVNTALLAVLGLVRDMRVLDFSMEGFQGMMIKYMITGSVAYILWSAGALFLSGRLLNRGVDL